MKKYLPILLAVLLLSACGAAPETALPETTPAESATESAAPEAEAAQTETPAEPEETGAPEETGEEKTETEETAPTAEPESVTLDGVSSYLRLTLPEGWTWKEGESGLGLRSLVLSAPTDDGFQAELVLWDFFGMCGTGVEFREIELADGMHATLATEVNGGYLWWTLILPPSPDQFTLQFGAEREVYEAHKAELDEILDSIRIGVLAEPQTVESPKDSF